MSQNPIVEITLEQLDPRVRKQIENLEKNLDKNPGYCVELCSSTLKTHPGCAEIRKLMRKAQRKMSSGQTGGLSKLFKNVTRTPFAMMGNAQVKKDPVAALESAEKMIAEDISSTAGFKRLGDAAMQLKLWKTAVMAFEDYRKLDSDNLEVNIALGNAYIEAKQTKEAISLGDAIRRSHPGNEAAQEIIRKAAIAQTLERGGWEKDASFRDKLANEAASVEREQSQRMVRDEDVSQKVIEKNLKLIQETPDDINLYREVIASYKSLQNFEKALEWTRKARATPNGKTDPTLERWEVEYAERVLDAALASRREALNASPADEALKAEVARLESERTAFRLKSAREMVERYPNDYVARFKLGELLVQSGDLDGAIRELQLAQRNPQVRVKAILFTGRAFLAKGIADLAVEQLQIAKKDVPGMDDLKKEIIYELARAHEVNGNTTAAIDEYKLIYQSDIGYRDVAAKINAFYSQKRS